VKRLEVEMAMILADQALDGGPSRMSMAAASACKMTMGHQVTQAAPPAVGKAVQAFLETPGVVGGKAMQAFLETPGVAGKVVLAFLVVLTAVLPDRMLDPMLTL